MSRHIDKEALVAAVMSSTELDNEQKSQLIGLIREQKKYGLVWEDSTEDAWEKMKTSIPVLNEVDDKRILNDTALPVLSAPALSALSDLQSDSTEYKDLQSDNRITNAHTHSERIANPLERIERKAYPNHAIIEADNLHALIALSYTHAGMIDVIYIDPPYNTGNKDFVYNDTFIGEDDAYRHSKWLSFMEKRLQIAKTLLSEKGVIFISIDDNEQANLKLLCDEVLGSENFVGNVIWEKTDSPRMDVSGFTVRHDYILVYKKSSFVLRRIMPDEIPEHYNKVDDKGRRYYLKPLRLMGGHKSDSLYYGIIAPDGTTVFPKESNGENGCWRWSKTKYENEIERIEWIKGKKGWSANFRIYAENLTPTPANTIWPFTKVGSTRTAKMELSNIVQQFIFSYPKPTSLILFIEKIASDKDSLILDFFAGSGTTLHATMQLNAEDGGHRQCILVTNNENNICEEVTYERNKRVIEGYTTPKGEQVAGLNHNNLRYYKLDFNPRKQSHQGNRELFYGLKDLLCIKENIYQEQQQFGSLSLEGKEQMLRYFAENGREMLMVYDTRVIPFIVSEIAQRGEQEQPLKIYIFADGAYPYTDDFASVIEKVSLVPMPYAYYRGIKDSLPDAEPTKVDDTKLTNEEQQAMMAEAIEAEKAERKEDTSND